MSVFGIPRVFGILRFVFSNVFIIPNMFVIPSAARNLVNIFCNKKQRQPPLFLN